MPLVPVTEPNPALYQDEVLGQEKVYLSGKLTWIFSGKPPFTARVDFQGCREASGTNPAMCFMPQRVDPLLERSEASSVESATKESLGILQGFKLERKAVGLLNTNEFEEFLTGTDYKESRSGFGADSSWFWIALLTLLGGLGLNLTPCVLPMIPVNLAIIGSGGSDRKAGFQRGLAYGVGMAGAYGMLGLAVVLAGARFGQLNASSWFNWVIAGVFALLALAMFGAFNLDFSGRINIKPSHLRGGKLVVALIMGAVSALLAGACVAPVVIAVLVLAAERYQGGEVVALGLPFILGIGMALPWPLAGAGLGVLPKPGRYMNMVKYVFGGIILLVAVYYGWVGYTLAMEKYAPANELARLETGIITAKEQGKPVLVELWASWCKNCKSMERNVLSDPRIQPELGQFELVRFQAEDPNVPEVAELLKAWEIPGLPAFVILRESGQ